MEEENSSRSRFRNLGKTAEQTPVYQPGFVALNTATPSTNDDAQFGMIISLGGGVVALMLGIWTFMVSETDSDWTFFWLSAGAFLALAASIALVELQFRRQGSLSIIHDYLLSFGLLFGLLCVYWLSRFLLYIVCGIGDGSSGLCQGESGSEGWMPGGWGIVVQSTAVMFAIIGLWIYTKRVNGGTVPRLVLVLAPLAIMVSGASIWVDYAADGSMLPLLIGVIAMSTTSMAVATDSDRSPLFLSAAIVSSITPFLYEAYLDRPGEGLSMLILIVLIQGVFAAHPGLSRKMIEKGSIALVALIIIAQWVASGIDADFILLEPIQHEWVSLPLMLWVALLVGYFWPVHQNRVPSMPIGLGFALLFIPGPGSMIAWCLALLSFVYMLTVPQTRRWVADWTLIGMMFAWWANGWLSESDVFPEISLDPLFAAIPPLVLIVSAHFGMREEKIGNSALNAALFMVLLSSELLLGSESWLPLGVATFLILLVWQQSRDAAKIVESGEEARMEATGRVGMAAVGILILELAGRLSLPLLSDLDLHIEAMIFAIALYVLGRGLRDVEVDVGQLIGQIGSKATGVPEFVASTGTWVTRESKISEQLSAFRLGPAARIGLWAPLLLFSLALAKSGNAADELYLVALLLIPVGILVYEVLNELPNDDKTRASAAWILFLIGLPTAFFLHFEQSDSLTSGLLLFDALLLSGPVVVDIALRQRGLEGEKNMAAGSATLLALIAIALLDTSGGLLAIPLFALVLSRAFAHRQRLAIGYLGFAWIIWVMMLDLDSTATVVSKMPEIAFLSEISAVELPRWAGIGLIVIGAPSFIGWLNDRRLSTDDDEVLEHPHPFGLPVVFILIGAFLLIPESHWFLVAGVVVTSIAAWAVGILTWYHFGSMVLFLTLLNAGYKEWDIDGLDLIRFAGAGAFIHNAALYLLDFRGQLFKNVGDSYPPESRQNLVDSIVISGIIFAVFADTYLMGLPLLLGIILFTQYTHQRRWANTLLLLPVVHGWVIARILNDPLPDYAVEISGFVMLIESLGLTWASWRMWDFEWTDWSDEKVISHANNSGWAGALIFIPAAWLLVNDLDAWMFGGMLCVHSAGQMAIGFQRDVNWRRIYAMIGVSVGFIIIWSDIDSGIMKGVMLVLASLSFMMQGFLYMSKAGIEMAGTRMTSTAVIEEISVEPEDKTDDDEEEKFSIPEPVVESETEPDDEPELVDEPEDVVEEQFEPILSVPQFGRIIGDRFDIELPLDVRQNIESTIDATQHEGFRAVVRWNPWGQVVLDWEETGEGI